MRYLENVFFSALERGETPTVEAVIKDRDYVPGTFNRYEESVTVELRSAGIQTTVVMDRQTKIGETCVFVIAHIDPYTNRFRLYELKKRQKDLIEKRAKRKALKQSRSLPLSPVSLRP